MIIMWQASVPKSVLCHMKNMYLGRSKGEKAGEKVATFFSNKVYRSQGSFDDDCTNMYKLKFDKLVGLVNGRRDGDIQ